MWIKWNEDITEYHYCTFSYWLLTGKYLISMTKGDLSWSILWRYLSESVIYCDHTFVKEQAQKQKNGDIKLTLQGELSKWNKNESVQNVCHVKAGILMLTLQIEVWHSIQLSGPGWNNMQYVYNSWCHSYDCSCFAVLLSCDIWPISF